MMEIMQPHLQFPSSSSSITDDSNSNDGSHQESSISYRGNTEHLQEGVVGISGWRRERKRREREEGGGGDQLSLLGVFVTVFRKSLVGCKSNFEEHLSSSSSCSTAMEISWPSNVRHVAHVTFDRFNGFLGLPVEFEPDVPRRPPSASTRVFGVSTECMQLSFDSRGNSVPTILLMMQWRLYSQGGLQAEGIFRINAENGQEEFVREQLNSGIIPNDIDVHCLAGLIKAWFRELPRGILDSLSPEEVMHAQSEDECVRLVRLLPSTEAALLDWAINLMADVAQLEHLNKMNARNVAMVFAPNMTQMADPLTALMYAVQVMNFLKTLIVRTLKDREESVVEAGPALQLEPFDENGHCSASHPIRQKVNEVEEEQDLISKGRPSNATKNSTLGEIKVEKETHGYLSSIENILPDGKGVESDDRISEITKLGDNIKDELGMFQPKFRRTKSGRSSSSILKKGSKKVIDRPLLHVVGTIEKGKEVRVVNCLNLQTERVEAWR